MFSCSLCFSKSCVREKVRIFLFSMLLKTNFERTGNVVLAFYVFQDHLLRERWWFSCFLCFSRSTLMENVMRFVLLMLPKTNFERKGNVFSCFVYFSRPALKENVMRFLFFMVPNANLEGPRERWRYGCDVWSKFSLKASKERKALPFPLKLVLIIKKKHYLFLQSWSWET